ncbi:hypothetical protein DV736_g5424, partial [Chaetothyriales sp. CBS 134916]
MALSSIYSNPQAQHWRSDHAPDLQRIQAFHHSLPDFNESALVPLDSLAQELGVRGVFVKDESSRLGLLAFKILGASWGTFRAICDVANLPAATTSLAEAAAAAQQRNLTLFAATDGNHGRAVARMAKILGIPARIFVPEFTSEPVRQNIASEGGGVGVDVDVVRVPGDYDRAVAAASHHSKAASPPGLVIQDNAYADYDQIPRYIVQGYATLLAEVEQQLAAHGLAATMIVTPIGVGSLGHAVTAYANVLTVEPIAAACLHANLTAGKFANPISTSYTIMDGLCCATVSPISWPTLQHGVDISLTITDHECHAALQYLHRHGVNAGPCGAAPLAGLLKLVGTHKTAGISAGASDLLNKDSVITPLE